MTKKNTFKKILFTIIFLLGVQVVQAQSYQRWIYWTNESHQVSAQEMGEITEKLFNGEIVADEVFMLSNGVSLKIPKPYHFLRHIRIAVLSVRPWATSKEQIVDAIYNSERFMWGNDVIIRVKNHWISEQNQKASFTNNYTGEGNGVFFLFIDGIPVIKCDCGNPLELLPEYYSFRHNEPVSSESDKTRRRDSDSDPQLQAREVVGDHERWQQQDSPVRRVQETQSVNTNIFPEQEKEYQTVVDWEKVALYGGIGSLALAVGTYGYYKLKDKPVPVLPDDEEGGPSDPPGPDLKKLPLSPTVGIRIKFAL